MRSLATVLLLSLLAGPGTAQTRFRQSVDIGAVDSVWSAALDEYRPYLVYTPPSYGDTTSTPQRYPVLYILDGDLHFHSVSGLVQVLATGVNGTFAIPEMIVVAIPNTNRTRDLTPTHATAGPSGEPDAGFERDSGGNGPFLTFLQDELIPHIETGFRTMPYRVLVGHSFGGIAVINALYTIPEEFNAYVAIDPSLWWDDATLLRRAKNYFTTSRLEGKALYMAQANTFLAADTVPNVHFSAISQFDAVMRAYDRSGIRYGFHYYSGEDHGSVPLMAEYDALRFIFEGYKVPIDRVISEPALLTEHFRDVSERLGARFQPSERMVGLLARFALTQDATAAIALGDIRAELYPESFRAYEFLGDVWAREDIEKARTYYEQALAQNPGNARLEGKLNDLGH